MVPGCIGNKALVELSGAAMLLAKDTIRASLVRFSNRDRVTS
jgi:hypothetical protein